MNLISSLKSKKQTTSGKGRDRAESHSDEQVSSSSARRRENMTKALDVTIGTIDAVNKLVPIGVANHILTGISSILVLLQTSLKNKEGLRGLRRNCEDICSTLALATKGVSIHGMGEALQNALAALHSSIDDLQSRVEGALQRGCMRRFFSASLDARDICAWTTDLDRIFVSFSARLNIVSAIRLEQIYELLQQPDIPTLNPDLPPPPPAMFFGREELLRDVKAVLLRDEDVTLIGPGGIGKSTLVMAVMNEEDIIHHFRRRFFVTYTGMDPKTITFTSFMDRIASVLGLPMTGAERERQIKTNLGLSPVLLVLDNAEAFEDAVDREEATRISDFIAYIANTPGITVVLTSRTSSNARRVSWTQFEVPPLEREPARLSFRKIYHGEMSCEEIDGLLASVDFHPLSISILAYAARENRWTGKVLLSRWKLQQGEILQRGDGKDNLGFTLRLSLESPSVKALGSDAVRVLWIVAFFPQGIHQDRLTHLFPSLPRILSIVDTLCKVSLIYLSDPFLTMLAPIRLFLLETFPATGLELLRDARCVYYSSMTSITEKRDSHADLIISDHLNIECLIAFDISHSPLGNPDIASVCRGFFRGLERHKPRPTSLSSAISSLPEGTTLEKDSKAGCLDALGRLYFELSIFSLAGALGLAASTLFVTVRNHSRAALCVSGAALSYNTRGYSARAQQVLDDFIRSPSWEHLEEECKAEIYFTLDWSRMLSSSEGVDSLFLRSMDHSRRGVESRVRHWRARMCYGYNTPEDVLNQLESLRSACMSSSNPSNKSHWLFLGVAIEAAFLQRKFDAAMQLLNQAQKVVHDGFRITTLILIFKAAVASEYGDYDLSRSLSQHCLDVLGVVAASSSTQFLRALYVKGRNELYAGHYPTVGQLLTDVVAYCDVYDDIDTKTLCMRALGEMEICMGHKSDSDKYFAKAVELCSESGAPPAFLGVCTPMLKLDDDKFPGWKSFLQAHMG